MSQSPSWCAGVSPQFSLQSSAAAPYATDYYPLRKKQSVTAMTLMFTCSLHPYSMLLLSFGSYYYRFPLCGHYNFRTSRRSL